MPGVVWETKGMALPSTASSCWRYTSCSRWLRSSRARAAEAFACSARCRMMSRRDSELCSRPSGSWSRGQGAAGLALGAGTALVGPGQACLAPEGGRPVLLSLQVVPALSTDELLQGRRGAARGLSGGLHGVPQASLAALACGRQVLHGRWKEGILGGSRLSLDCHVADGLQGSRQWMPPAQPGEEWRRSSGAQGHLRAASCAAGVLPGP